MPAVAPGIPHLCKLSATHIVLCCLYPSACVQPTGRYTRAWRAHVWAHLPFYTMLLPVFMELCYSALGLGPKPASAAAGHSLKVGAGGGGLTHHSPIHALTSHRPAGI